MSAARWLLAVLIFASVAACGPRSIKARIARGGDRVADANKVLDRAEKKIAEFQLADAQSLLDKAKGILSDPDVSAHPAGVRTRVWLSELKCDLEVADVELAKRQLAQRVAKQKEAVEQVLQPILAAYSAVDAPVPAKADFETLQGGESVVREALAQGKQLEAQDAGYLAYTKTVEEFLGQVREKLKKIGKLVAFIQGPAAMRAQAMAALERSRSDDDPAGKVAAVGEAIEKFGKCVEQGREAVAATPSLEKTQLQVEGKVVTVKALLFECGARKAASERSLGPLQKKAAAAAAKKAAAEAKAKAKEGGKK